MVNFKIIDIQILRSCHSLDLWVVMGLVTR